MQLDNMNRLKLDAGLTELLELGYLRGDSTVPVIVRSSAADLEPVLEAIAASNGTVRHVLERLRAVAAWLPLAALPQLLALPTVAELELDQVSQIA